MFSDVNDAIFYIENIKRKEKRKDLSKITKALSILNNPENSFKKIHVVGTNGKGSVVSYISNALYNHNYKVGCFISPYVIQFNERFSVNKVYITNEEILKYTNQVLILQKIFEESDEVLTFFEVLTIIAFLYFQDHQVDYAVIEAGVGGLLDVTNVCNYDLSIITSIGYDHMNVLGNTLEEIATNKLGIIKENNHLITIFDDRLNELFINCCKDKNATIDLIDTKNISHTYINNKLVFNYKDNKYSLNLLGNYQINNAVLAVEAIHFLLDNYNNDILVNSINETSFVGRFEVFFVSNKTIVIDGAHNISAIEVLCDSLKEIYKDKYLTFIFTALKDKEIEKMLNKISEVSDMLYVTSFIDRRSVDTKELYDTINCKNKGILVDVLDVMDYIKTSNKENEVIVITGSLHYISLIRNYLISFK